MFDRRSILLSGPALALAASAATARTADDPAANKALIRRFFEEVWSTGDLSRRDSFLAEGYRGHVAGAAEPIDRDGWSAWFQGFRTAFPDARFTVEDMVAEGDRAAARMKRRSMPPTTRRRRSHRRGLERERRPRPAAAAGSAAAPSRVTRD
jgi:predicted SnoaL-like aldol condensation-catalyzing enzyme